MGGDYLTKMILNLLIHKYIHLIMQAIMSSHFRVVPPRVLTIETSNLCLKMAVFIETVWLKRERAVFSYT